MWGIGNNLKHCMAGILRNLDEFQDKSNGTMLEPKVVANGVETTPGEIGE
jgi:hypothetical protein